jgi:hypothetical protein
MPKIVYFSSLLTTLLFAPACQAGCRNEIINRVKSPTGIYAAAIFERNCGATSGNNIQVSIFRNDDATDGPGNTFVIDYPSEYYQQGRPLPAVKLRWNNESSATIEYSSGARIFTQANMIQGVSVSYVIK